LNIAGATEFKARLSTYVPIVTQQFATLTSASVTFSGLATVEKGRMLAAGKNSLHLNFTVCVFRKLPAFDFTLLKE
jgi:hypothetical protein